MVIAQKCTVIDTEVLRKGIRMCKAFAVSLPGQKNIKYYYAGGFYDECNSNIVLQIDYIRPCFKTIPTKDVIHTMFDGTYCDVLFKNGTWISGVVVNKIRDAKYDYLSRRFYDKRIMSKDGDIEIIDLLSLQPKQAEQNALYHIHTPSKEILKYPNPLTFAYIKDKDETRIGYWDMVENKLIGKTERLEIPIT